MMDSQGVDFPTGSEFDSGQMGILAHLYRGEVYRSTVWRTRLDNTTNWAVVTTGIALSATFSSREASPLPMVLVGLLVTGFLLLEARRYRYFYVWRVRARVLETRLFAAVLTHDGPTRREEWCRALAEDYLHPHFAISFRTAVGRRLRSNYGWLFLVQAICYYGKLAIHPYAMTTLDQISTRAAIGIIPGGVVVLCGVLFHGSWMMLALVTWLEDRRHRNAASHTHDIDH